MKMLVFVLFSVNSVLTHLMTYSECPRQYVWIL
jgi:hypothetical protein